MRLIITVKNRSFSRLAIFDKYCVYETSYESLKRYIESANSELETLKKALDEYVKKNDEFLINYPQDVLTAWANLSGSLHILTNTINNEFQKQES